MKIHKADWCFLCHVFLATLGFLCDETNSKDIKDVDISSALSLSCPPCDRIHCRPRKPGRLKCRGGVTSGICGCCPVCAKLEGEKCGGYKNYRGKCDRGLYCHLGHTDYAGKGKALEGTCKKDANSALSDQPMPSYCKPKCTPEFCLKHPKAICSAQDNNLKQQKCQGQCQHTSCSACQFVKDDLDCIKCRKDDFYCMKEFSKCIKQPYCTRDKFPCKKNLKSKPDPAAKFQCQVPECLSP